MKTIWKYPLDPDGGFSAEIDVPVCKVLAVQVQGDQPCIWIELDPGEPKIATLQVVTVGTGHIAPDDGTYLGTFQVFDGRFVGHVYYRLLPLPEWARNG